MKEAAIESIPKLLSLKPDYWFLQTLAMMLTALILPKLRITSIFGAFFIVVALALVNSMLWDTALFFKIPDNFTTEAIALFAANGIIFFVLVKLLPGIEIQGIVSAFLAPVIFTVCSLLISRYADHIDWNAVWQFLQNIIQTAKEFITSKQDNGS